MAAEAADQGQTATATDEQQAYLERLLAAVEKAEALAEHEHKTQRENLTSALLSAEALGLSGDDVTAAKMSLDSLHAADAEGGADSSRAVAEAAARKFEKQHTGARTATHTGHWKQV